jgi:hypothetical protein
MDNITNITVIPTETIIDLYNGGTPPPELSAFAFFVILGTIASIFFVIVIESAENA